MNRLEKWCKDGVIYLFFTDVVQKEAEDGNSPLRSAKAWRRPGLGVFSAGSDDQELWNTIAATVFPNGIRDDNQRNDVQILFTTQKFGMILVTNDGDSKSQPGGILGHAKELLEKVHVRVLRDSEAVKLVEEQIAQRDALERRFAPLMGRPPAEWLGRD